MKGICTLARREHLTYVCLLFVSLPASPEALLNVLFQTYYFVTIPRSNRTRNTVLTHRRSTLWPGMHAMKDTIRLVLYINTSETFTNLDTRFILQ